MLRPELTHRQRQIAEGVLAGETPTQLSARLGLSTWTVRDHVRRLCAIYGAAGIRELHDALEAEDEAVAA